MEEYFENEEVIAYALQIHNLYEKARYGYVIGSMPYISKDQEYMYRQAQWLAHFGTIADFEDPDSLYRYYGTFEGYDIYFAVHTAGTGTGRRLPLGQITFSHDGSYGFTMYAIKGGRLYYLSDIYAMD